MRGSPLSLPAGHRAIIENDYLLALRDELVGRGEAGNAGAMMQTSASTSVDSD